MEKSEIIELIAIVFGMSISICIGLFVLIGDFKKKKYLGFFLIVYGISFLTEVFGFFNLKVYDILPFSLSFLHTSLLYSHINSLLIQGNKKIQKNSVLFGIISFLIGLAFFINMQYNSQASILYELYKYVSAFYFLSIYILCIVQIIKHDRIIKQQYSNITNRELKYHLILLIFALLFLLVFMPILTSSIQNPYITIYIVIGNTLWIVGIAYISLNHLVSKNFIIEPLPTIPLKGDKEEKEEEQYKELFTEIKNTITKNELFLNSDLTIMEVALAVNQHPKLVSKTINTNTDVNFNSFINDFRVEYAKILLKNPQYQHIKIDEIGKIAGFRSKSVFYSNFKRVLKITPLQFQKG